MARNWKKMSKEDEDKKRQIQNPFRYNVKVSRLQYEQHVADSRTESSCHSPCRL